MKHLIAIVALTLVAAPAAADLMKPAGPTTIRGTITAFTGQTLSVKANDGSKVTILLAPDAKVASVSVVAIDAIKPNSFIGTTAEEGPGGVLRATEVHVFPEAMRGAGEGHYPWDVGKTSMTNGNVTSMTNGNVGAVGTAQGSVKGGAMGRTLVVDYKGGQQKVIVPANVPIVALDAGTPALLVPGAHIFTRAMNGPDGKLVTKQVAVGIKGTVPPM